jgi:uncharacterized protein
LNLFLLCLRYQLSEPAMTPSPDIHAILSDTKTIALVGASPKAIRPSNEVMKFLLEKGYHVIPVNPGLAGTQIHGQTVVGSLADIKEPVDMVDIFRNTEDAATVIEEAIALKDQLKLKTVWCQLDILPLEAGARAEAAGLKVVMDRCPKIEYQALQGPDGRIAQTPSTQGRG